MKKRSRVLVLLLAAGMVVGLCGCSNSAASTSNPPSVPASQAVMDAPTPEPTPTPEPIPTPEPELHGLVIVEGYAGAYPSYAANTTVYCLDLETGEKSAISRFDYIDSTLQGNSGDTEKYEYRSAGISLASEFSDDFSLLAKSKYCAERGEWHAGWIDTSGNFFDVTEALGQQAKSDFDPAVDYRARGFSNGCFEFSKGAFDCDYFYVPLDNIVPEAVKEGTLFSVDGLFEKRQGGLYFGEFRASDITSWIDDTHCIINRFYKKDYTGWIDSVILDTENLTTTSYVPGDSTSNWNGVVSPDGTKIAFMACRGAAPSIYDDKNIDVYIIPIEGGDPVKVTDHPYNLDEITGTLIGWI